MQRTGGNCTLDFASRLWPAADRPYVMRQKLPVLLIAVLLVACAASATQLVRSCWWGESVAWNTGSCFLTIRTQRGHLQLSFDAHSPGMPSGLHVWQTRLDPARPFLGFGVLSWRPGNRAIVLPLWLLAAVGAGSAAGVLRRTSRSGDGSLCPHCEYDLRATPNRCPECGRLPHNPPMQRTVPAV